MAQADGESIYATTLEEVLEAFNEVGITIEGSFRMGVGVKASSNNWNLDPTTVSSMFFDADGEINSIGRREDGWVEFDVGNRYRLTEPLDVEIRPTGFVVWSAAAAEVSPMAFHYEGELKPAPWPRRQWYRKYMKETRWREFKPETMREIRTYGDFEAIDLDEPLLFGMADYRQFPLPDHGWRPASTSESNRG